MTLFLLIIAPASANVLCGRGTAVIPDFSLDEVPATTTFAVAESWWSGCGADGTLSLSLTADADDAAVLQVEDTFEGTAGLLQAAPDAPLVVGTTYTLTYQGERQFTATDEAIEPAVGEPELWSVTAERATDGSLTVDVGVTPVEYAEGLSMVGLESNDGRLLNMTHDTTFLAVDPAPTDDCYLPVQVFADGSIVRGDAVCPEVTDAPWCATSGGGPAALSVAVAMISAARRRRRTGRDSRAGLAPPPPRS